MTPSSNRRSEHLDILRLLDLQFGIIVLTKVHLVDPGWIEFGHGRDSGIRCRHVFALCPGRADQLVVTGSGLDDSPRRELELAAKSVADQWRPDRVQGPFRLAIDQSSPSPDTERS